MWVVRGEWTKLENKLWSNCYWHLTRNWKGFRKRREAGAYIYAVFIYFSVPSNFVTSTFLLALDLFYYVHRRNLCVPLPSYVKYSTGVNLTQYFELITLSNLDISYIQYLHIGMVGMRVVSAVSWRGTLVLLSSETTINIAKRKACLIYVIY